MNKDEKVQDESIKKFVDNCKPPDIQRCVNYTRRDIEGPDMDLVIRELIPADRWVAIYEEFDYRYSTPKVKTITLPLLGFGLLYTGEIIPLVIDEHGVIGNPCEEEGFTKVVRE